MISMYLILSIFPSPFDTQGNIRSLFPINNYIKLVDGNNGNFNQYFSVFRLNMTKEKMKNEQQD